MADWTYDVFLNFRGKDIRQRFIGHLYEALCGRGIHTFLDGEELEGGEDITSSLLHAVDKSRIAIPVFSPNYATSHFCLDELVKIIKCSETNGQIVLPVFYEVDPSHVRHQTGSFGEALAKDEERRYKDDRMLKHNMERVEAWRMALQQVANFSGYHFKQGGETEHEFIEKIVKQVSKWIHCAPLHVADHLVGLESQVLKVTTLLGVGSGDGVHMVGIHGIGGIGKTTIACAVYNSIVDSFEGACFLGNVRENSTTHGLIYLQEMMLSKLVKEKDIKLGDVHEGTSMIKHKLKRKKVLLIVDDVDKLEQLKAIVGDSNWFGSGSKVIITTRNKGLLASHGVKKTYEVEKLNDKEALDLLRWNAFKTNQVDTSYADVLNHTTTFASGLPLALEIIGSHLFGKSKEEWESALDQYRRNPKKEIQQILKVSFDDLERDERKFFLDIACFYNGYRLEYVEEILRAHHGVCPKNGIRVLVDKSLVKIDDGNVTLHDLIQDMGKEIVRQESLEKPGKCSRMWFSEDIRHVFKENKGSGKIESIVLVLSKFDDEKEIWDSEAFKKIDNLKTLIINEGCFREGLKYLPNSLKVLKWHKYPSQFFPSDFYPKDVVILQLANSCLSSLNLFETKKKFMNLRVLNVEYSQFIEKIPDVSNVPNLEELSFCGCKNLIEVHESVGLLDKLRIVDGYGCSKLRSFPTLMLPSLERLNLSECSSLENFPEILGKMEYLTELVLAYTPIKEFPFSIQYLTRLRKLELWFSGIVQLPITIFLLRELKHLSIQQCEGLLLRHNGEEKVSSMVFSSRQHFDFSSCNVSNEFLQIGLPWFVNVKELDLSLNSFTILPACIKGCTFLKKLTLDYCRNLKEIQGLPPDIETFSAIFCTSLKDLDLTLLPASTKECRFLKGLHLNGCENLQEIRGVPPNIEVLHAPKRTFLVFSSKSLILNQEFHKEGGGKEFWLPIPGTKILEWSTHSCRGSSISFWFRNKFPAISFCVVSEQDYSLCVPKLIINGHEVHRFSRFMMVKDHILILGQKLMTFKDEIDNALFKNEWNHVELFDDPPTPSLVTSKGTKQIGLQVLKQSGDMENIRFTDPLLSKEKHRLVGKRHSRTKLKQQKQILASFELHERQGRVPLLLSPPPALKDNLNWDFGSTSSKQMNSMTSVQASLDYLAKALGEESSGEVSRQEIYTRTCSSSNALQTTLDKSSRNQAPLIQDDKEMEAFYTSLDAKTHVASCSYDKSTITAPSKEAREALQIVQDFISNDASILSHPEQCRPIKFILDYLSNLSHGMSREMKTLVSEASRVLTHWSRDYTEASMKIESTVSELKRADELEAGLEANKRQFWEVVALENELLQKLAWIEKRKKELEEQLNACESERSIAFQRKRDVFKEGKTLTAQIEEVRKKVPHMQHEQDLAAKTQAKIAAEWSKLREKFKTIVIDSDVEEFKYS